MWGLHVINHINNPSQEVLGLLDQVRIAVQQSRLSDAERLMKEAMSQLKAQKREGGDSRA